LNLDLLQERLKIKVSDHILNVYNIGSRLYGTANANSDYDMIVILASEGHRKWLTNMRWLVQNGWIPSSVAKVKIKRGFEGFDDFQAWIFDPRTFQILLQYHVPFAIECFFAPETCIWKNSTHFKFELNPTLLQESYTEVAKSHWKIGCSQIKEMQKEYKKANPVIEKENEPSSSKSSRRKIEAPSKKQESKYSPIQIYKSRKLLHHAMRMLMFGCQLLEHGKIVNFSEANPLRQELMSFECAVADGWDPYELKFEPIFMNLCEKLMTIHSTIDNKGKGKEKLND